MKVFKIEKNKRGKTTNGRDKKQKTK